MSEAMNYNVVTEVSLHPLIEGVGGCVGSTLLVVSIPREGIAWRRIFLDT